MIRLSPLLLLLLLVSCQKKESPKINLHEPIPKESVVVKASNKGKYFLPDSYETLKTPPPAKHSGDTIFLPLVHVFHPFDSLGFWDEYIPTIKFKTYQNVVLSDSGKIIAEFEKLKIIGINFGYDTVITAVKFFKDQKLSLAFSHWIPNYVNLGNGFGGSEKYSLSTLRVERQMLLKIESYRSPSAPGWNSFDYYILSSEDSLIRLDNKFGIIVGDIEVHNNRCYTFFTKECITVKIPLEIDLENRRIQPLFKDSAIFLVDDYRIWITNGSETGSSYPNPLEEIRLFKKPDLRSDSHIEPVYTIKDVEFIKEYYPKFTQHNYNDVWSYVRIGNRFGWIYGEDRDKLGIDACS